MFNLKLDFRKILLVTLLFLFASCTPQVAPGSTGADSDETSGETMQDDHGDEDHDEDGHGDEDHDEDGHGDEDHDEDGHGDEDHDEDGHGDEDHDEDGHGDEDHDEDGHGDEDHDEDGHGDDDHREHGAHEHGAAELSVALIDGKAEVSLETPAFNMVGFEYAPNTDEEIAAVDAALEVLEKGEWLTLSDAAGCSLASADVDSSMGEAKHDEDHHEGEDEDHDEDHEEEGHDEDHHDEEGETHSSFFVTYNFDCTSLEDLTSLDATMLFTNFPNFEEVDAQWLNDTQQSAAVLDKDQPVLSFE